MQAAFRRIVLVDAVLSEGNLKPGVQGEKRPLIIMLLKIRPAFPWAERTADASTFARRFSAIEATNSETEISSPQMARS